MLFPILQPSGSSQRFATRRFAVRQRSSTGQHKLRPIDDFSESGLNSACSVLRKIRMGQLQDLHHAVHSLSAVSSDLLLCKSDFSKAYRNCPIHSSHLPLADILIRRTKVAFASRDHGIPAAPRVAAAVARHAGWDAAECARQVEAYRAEVARLFTIDD